MAISQMNRVSLLAPEHHLDDLLKVIQGLQQIEIVDLNDSDQWQDVSQDTMDLIEDYAHDEQLTDREIMNHLENRLHRIERAIELVERYVSKPSFMQRMKNGIPEVSYRQIEFHGKQFEEKEIVERVNYLVERLDELEETIEETRDMYNDLLKWKNLEITPSELNKFKYVNGVIGRVPSTNEDKFIHYLKNDDALRYETVFINENDYGVIIFSDEKERNEIVNDLKEYQFLPFKYASNKLPKNQLEEFQETIETAKKERSEITAELKNFASTLDELKLQYEYVSNINEREQAKLLFGRTQNLVSIQGWIEQVNAAQLIQLIQSRFNNEVIIRVREINEADRGKVPTKIKNNNIINPFEMITEMYGTPAYDEIDPTPFVMPFYWVFFGMMIADLGYGLLLAIASAIPLFGFNLKPSAKRTARLVFILSTSVMLWGAIYGSFFGFTIEWMQLIDLQGQVMEVMILSMAIGLIHMGIGFGINTYLKVKNKEYAIAYAEGFQWILVILGIILLVAGRFIPSLSSLATFGGWLIAISFIGMFIAYVVDAGSISGLGAGLLGLINAVSYFGDVISYSRLMALGLSGVSIGAAFNLIIAQIPPVGRFTLGIVLFVFLHLFNMFLSLLTGGVHALRLIFVEFFGKFYSGNGRKFKPLKVNEKYVQLKNNQKVEE